MNHSNRQGPDFSCLSGYKFHQIFSSERNSAKKIGPDLNLVQSSDLKPCRNEPIILRNPRYYHTLFSVPHTCTNAHTSVCAVAQQWPAFHVLAGIADQIEIRSTRTVCYSHKIIEWQNNCENQEANICATISSV